MLGWSTTCRRTPHSHSQHAAQIFASCLWFSVGATSACHAGFDRSAEQAAVSAVLYGQRDAWNRGHLEEYMAGYWRDERLRFAAGNNITYGWQATLDRYQKNYPNQQAMGTLAFDLQDIRVLSPQDAVVFGKWQLTREAPHQPAGGLFTLILEKKPEGWKVVADHTSG